MDCFQVGDLAGAEDLARQLIAADSKDGEAQDVSAYINLGGMNVRAGSLEVAIFILQCATQIDPKSHAAWNNLGDALMYLNRTQEAEEAFHRAIALHPGSDSEFNLALLLLRCGRFTEGWPLYEHRWQAVDKEKKKRLQLKQPEWDGGALGQRTILVYHEQGFGDSLQFVRYLMLLCERHPHAKISFLCPLPLARLFVPLAAAWRIALLSRFGADNLPPYDVHVALMSLPWWMGTTLETIPATIPYLVPPLECVQQGGTRLASFLDHSCDKKVGIIWRSGTNFVDHLSRNLSLESLAPLFEIGGIQWVALQKPAGEIAEKGWSDRISDPMGEVEDFADTAGLIAYLDLVISVDTSVAHLAGAMGKPVWLLNRFNTDWRWLLDREDCPWYPTMRIFRQPSFGDWEPVIQRVTRALADWVACK